MKSDRLLYKATALDAPANASAEQPIVGGSLSSERQAVKEEGLILTLESAAANTQHDFSSERQAEKNDGEIVMLSPKDKVESLSTPQLNLSSDGKDKEKVFFDQEIGDK